MNYSNSQRDGVILYFTALLFGAYHKEAIKLKLSYMAQKNESSKNRNGVILNALLYFISVISLIGTLDVLEDRMNIPFCCSFAIVVFLSSVLGILWLVIEWRRNERF